MSSESITLNLRDDPGGLGLAGGFFVVSVVVFAVLELGGVLESTSEVIGLGFLLVAPPLLGLLNAVRGGALASTLVIGIVPTVAFLVVDVAALALGTLDGVGFEIVGLALAFATVGTLGALCGFAVGYLGQLAAERYATG